MMDNKQIYEIAHLEVEWREIIHGEINVFIAKYSQKQLAVLLDVSEETISNCLNPLHKQMFALYSIENMPLFLRIFNADRILSFLAKTVGKFVSDIPEALRGDPMKAIDTVNKCQSLLETFKMDIANGKR